MNNNNDDTDDTDDSNTEDSNTQDSTDSNSDDIVDAILGKKNYILLLSGNDNKLLEDICKDVAKDLKFKYSNSFLKDDKNIGLIIYGYSFPSDNINYTVDYHIHINKKDNPDYNNDLKSNTINKFINVKENMTPSQIGDIIFELVIKDIEKKVYKK